MRNYTYEQIEEYIATGDPFDKAGAYGIQHPQFRPVAELDGCYLNVVGLPLCLLDRLLRQAGITPKGPAAPTATDGHCAYCARSEHRLNWSYLPNHRSQESVTLIRLASAIRR